MSEELARRAVACKHWRWAPGMRCLDGSRMLCTGQGRSGPWQAWSDEHYAACACKLRPEETRDDLPDLTDAATVGALLALVREAWGVPDLYVAPVECIGPGPAPAWRAWAVEGPDLHVYTTSGKTEAEALVAALESAP